MHIEGSICGPLFEGISAESCNAMRQCFGMVDKTFRGDEVIYDFDDGYNMVGVVEEGRAYVEHFDEKGSRTVLEHLEPGSVFGEMLMFENVTGDTIRVICDRMCRVCFMQGSQITKRCEHACDHHSMVVENLFHLVAEKALVLSERVEVLSRRSIREKLMAYFTLQLAKRSSNSFELPFSLSTLADYISTDRSAMMRELKKMRDESIVQISGRNVTILT